ncbi:hypothetical protein RHGRI_002373 [Rhododendron griersonianum]|uniref:V-type proton ATPase subunit a n=1 Tax=Rhododendron griersonianum TaxID=479676 RepID=A0AAV6LPX8_9ERIC|nr:hypothetical protein RHGRI_002373 [Rhododendron griersonianum]
MGYIDKLPAMDLMRSEKMTPVQLIIPVESARRAVSYLGQLGLLQFRDLNADKSPFQRTFVNQVYFIGFVSATASVLDAESELVKRCAEMSRKLRFFKDQIHKAGLMSAPRPILQPKMELEQLEIHLAEYEHELLEMNNNSEQLRQSYNELLELKIVLQKAGGFLVSSKSHVVSEEIELDDYVYSNEDYADTTSLLEKEMRPGPSNQSGLSFISGIIIRSKVLMFERMLFRATRGNMLFSQAPADEKILDPVSTEMVEKMAFVVFFSGEQAKTKILRICEAFGANCYSIPEDITEQRQLNRVVLSRLSELEATLDAGIRHRNNALTFIGSQLSKWIDMVRREKAVYDTLNMLNFDVTKKCLVGEGWCPIFAKTQIQEVLQRATFDSNSQVGVVFHAMDAVESPPTYFRTNRFTNSFQEIVDAYGVARYQEANPAVYTIITFPFLFAVMFGDWGHGICLLLGALFLISRESKLGSQKLGSIMEMVFGGRYLLLLMSLFSIYCGLIYNEFFSVPYHIFGGSAYKCRDATCSCEILDNNFFFDSDAHSVGLVKFQDAYPFGVDPSWRGSRSELPFLNSLKMKMSILLGVTQMNLGIILSYFNARFFHNSLDFRYLLQIILLLLAIIAVPWMLFPKPFILKKLHSERFQGRTYKMLGTSEMDMDVEPDFARQHDEDFNFSEVFVHQMIHSIEFVLGSVSNTASYLRLWALSLAHSELSTVFYEKVLLLAWGYDSIIIRLVGLAVFAFATAFILLMMETLSAFLHALRLHWVEFMNKFYHGDGYKFRPFSFASLTDADD